MQCNQCGKENRHLAKFCLACGTALVTINQVTVPAPIGCECPSCHHSNSAGTKFCSQCGCGMQTNPTPISETPNAIATSPSHSTEAVVAPQETIAPSPTSSVTKDVPTPVSQQAEKYTESPHEQSRFSSPLLKTGLAAVLLIALGAGGWWFSQSKATSNVARNDNPPTVESVTASVPVNTQAEVEPILEPTPKNEMAATAVVKHTAVSAVVVEPSPEEIAKRNAELQTKKKAAEQARKKREAAAIVKRQERQAEEQSRANNRQIVPSQTHAVAPTSLSEQVAACKQRSFLEREKCLWSLCNNRWGNNGCPSYDN